MDAKYLAGANDNPGTGARCKLCGADATHILITEIPAVDGTVYHWPFPLVSCAAHATPQEPSLFYDEAWKLRTQTGLALLKLPAAKFDEAKLRWADVAELVRMVGGLHARELQ